MHLLFAVGADPRISDVPSRDDLHTAAAVGVPVFVVTDYSIATAMPGGRPTFYGR